MLLYNFFVRLYILGIHLAAAWNPKAREWVNGRKTLFGELKNKIKPDDRIIWFHCASAGEFEQGKPVIEEMKKKYPSFKVLVSFFSPSGYQAAKKYQYADIISYLPADTKKNAKQFIEIAKPELVVFVKYEYWYHHLSAIAFHHIPLLMVSAIFRGDQLFFRWYGKFYRQLLFLFRHLFVQDELSLQLLWANHVHHCSKTGDTRFDRVKKIADHFTEVPLLKEFIGESTVIVAGSTWQQDEELLASYVNGHSIKLIIAPHEIKKEHINHLKMRFPDSILYSEISNASSHPVIPAYSIWNSISEQQKKDAQKIAANAKTLVIDSIGMLSRLYHYGTISYVGGGFKTGIHNTLEAVVFGKPVVFGPKYQKFKEAKDLIEAGAAFSIANTAELKIKMDHLLNDPQELLKAGRAAQNYVEENTGATQKIMQFIQENRLLTR